MKVLGVERKIPNSGYSYAESLHFKKYVRGREKGNPNWNLSYTNHWYLKVPRHTWQTRAGELACKNLVA